MKNSPVRGIDFWSLLYAYVKQRSCFTTNALKIKIARQKVRTRTSNKVEYKFVICFPHARKWRQLKNTAAVLPTVSNELNESSHLHQDFWISSLTMRLFPSGIRSNSRGKERVIQSNSSENVFFFRKKIIFRNSWKEFSPQLRFIAARFAMLFLPRNSQFTESVWEQKCGRLASTVEC